MLHAHEVTDRLGIALDLHATYRGLLVMVGLSAACGNSPLTQEDSASECSRSSAEWIWCDDFETDRTASYFEHSSPGDFRRESTVGLGGSTGMTAEFDVGQIDAGALRLAFGRTPQAYLRPVDAGTSDYREVFWRVYLRNQPGWVGGGGDKLSRATALVTGNWAQAMIAHVWSGPDSANWNVLVVDPASGTDGSGTLRTTAYNDFPNLRWLGADTRWTNIFGPAAVGTWRCIEVRVRLNDPGLSNGIFQMWIDDVLEADRSGLNWLGSYAGYGINAVFLENYWNRGSPAAQQRYFDNFVVSRKRIGCEP